MPIGTNEDDAPTSVAPTPVGPTPVGPTPVSPTPVGPTAVDLYIKLGQQLSRNLDNEAHLLSQAANLPPFTRAILDTLVTIADSRSLSQPRESWALLAVAAAAACLPNTDRHTRFLQGLTAWHLARMANAWVQPQRIFEAVDRASEIFADLQEPGWQAACAWQRNEIPWIRGNAELAVQELQKALPALDTPNLRRYLPDCHLALAFAYMLANQFAAAARQIALSKTLFAADDRLGHWRCLNLESSLIRRTNDNLAQAMALLEEALALSQEIDAPLYKAMTCFQYGYVASILQNDYETAITYFLKAAQYYREAHIDLRYAQSLNGLIPLYSFQGDLVKAADLQKEIAHIYAQYNMKGPQADNLLDVGLFELFRGQYEQGLRFFFQAELLYGQAGNEAMKNVAIMNQGEAHLYLGRYQTGLQLLERAHHYFEAAQLANRLAECEERLARGWLQIDQPLRAQMYVDRIINYLLPLDKLHHLADTYSLLAEILLQAEKYEETAVALQTARDIAHSQQLKPQIAFCERLLAEVWLKLGDMAKAHTCLATAEKMLIEMGTLIAQAECQLGWGRYYQQIGQPQRAQEAWQKALDQSQGLMPDIAWQAYGGLAQFAQANQQPDHALVYYRQAVAALSAFRQGVWQPDLTNAYLQRSAKLFDEAVACAVAVGSPADVVQLIEAGKAQTTAFLWGSKRGYEAAAQPEQIANLAAEIHWLYDQLRDGWPTVSSAKQAAWIQRLRRQTNQYNVALGEWERQQSGGSFAGAMVEQFNIQLFREMANQRVGRQWMAVHYFLAEDQLSCVCLTPDESLVFSRPYTPKEAGVLRQYGLAYQPQAAVGEWGLVVMGQWLLPEEIWRRLTPDSYLFIVPHRQLHWLPWAALRVGVAPHSQWEQRPLVSCCIPVIIPSLRSLQTLWLRAPQGHAARQPVTPGSPVGLLAGVSTFPQKHGPLPQVQAEINQLAARLGEQTTVLRETAVTWDNLLQHRQAAGLSHFDFLHIASHVIDDSLTGRLSAIALYGEDIWLDQLWELAPLPNLVFFSACNSHRHLVYAGDEAVGLPITCLATGTQNVVGSLWPILDGSTNELIDGFYTAWLAGQPPATALALAQRAIWQTGAPLHHWGGHLCLGCG